MTITRRNMLEGTIALTGAMLCGNKSWSTSASSFTDFFVRSLPTAEELWRGQQLLADNSPPRTGSPGHNRFVDYLAQQLQQVGIEPQRRRFNVPYWETSGYGIKLKGKSLPVAGVQPRSGATPRQGITAPLHYAGLAPKVDYGDAAGKIVLIEVSAGGSGLYRFGEPYGVYPPEEHFPLDEIKAQWSGRRAPDAREAFKAGAVGVIFVLDGFSDGVAKDLELNFDRPLINIPVLWVSQRIGQQLRAEAAHSTPVTMILNAVVAHDAPTDNLWGVLPGKTDEVVLIQTHTDGCNSLEDNGGLFVVALAKALANTPIAQRNRSYAFVMTTGHFAHAYAPGTEDWIEHNQELVKRMVAALVIEHVGAKEWIDNPVTGKYQASGNLAWGRPNVTNDALKSLLLKAVTESDVRRVAVLGADPKTRAMTGEGTPWATRGIPTIGYIGGEHWLFSNPGRGGYIERMDKQQMHRALTAFARTLEKMDTLSVAELGK